MTVGRVLWSGTGWVGTKEGFVFAVEGSAVAVVNILEEFPPPTFQTYTKNIFLFKNFKSTFSEVVTCNLEYLINENVKGV